MGVRPSMGYGVFSPDGICPTIPARIGGYGIVITERTNTERKKSVTSTVLQAEIMQEMFMTKITFVLHYPLWGGNQQPMIVAMRGRNSDNPKSREKSNYKQVLEPNTQGICNTLTSVQKDNLGLEEKPIIFDMYNKKRLNGDVCGTITTGCATGGSGTFGNVNPSNRGINGNVVSSDGLARARAITIEKGEGQKICDTQNADDYRIRKLTPRECWRLMGFSDADFDKAAAVNSNTQLYKEAGNSIVKNVLMAIFRRLNIQGENPQKASV